MLALALALSAAPAFSCTGPWVPPTDFDNVRGLPVELEFAVASAAPTTPPEYVEEQARRQLVNKLCRLAEPASCGLLAEKVKLWEAKTEKDKRCAMAVVSSADLEYWRTALAPDLDAELKKALKPLMPALDELPQKKALLTGKVKPRTVMVIVGGVHDNGAPGGLRAEWLLGRVRGVFTDMGVVMREPPRGWNGSRLPKDVELLVRGALVERVDPKRQLPVLEATFSAVDGKGVVRTARPFTMPAALAPQPPRPVTTPPPLTGLALHAETRRGGNLCPGDYTQLHVTNESDEELYVRVFNIDDNGEVLLLFPSETRPDDRLPAGKSVTLSSDGFTVEGGPGGRERYVALAARGPEGLGRFKDMRGTCRFQPTDARQLANGKKLEAAYRATAGFTLLDDVRCGKVIPLPDKQLQVGLLAELPWCPPLE